MFSKASVGTAIAAAALVMAAPNPAIDPLTVTSVSPAQSSALYDAGYSYGLSLANDPAITSIALELASNTAELAQFTGLAGSLTNLPTGSAALAQINSMIDQLPSDAASFYHSVVSAEISIASSVLNNGAVETGSSSGTGSKTGTTAKPTGTSSSGSSSSGSSASQQSSNAAATPGLTQAAGVAVGLFGAAVALL